MQERDQTDVPVSLPLDDRTFDLVLLSNWEDQIVYDTPKDLAPKDAAMKEPQRQLPLLGDLGHDQNNLTTPINKALESGAWTQSIIWSPNSVFRDFTQLELNEEPDVIPEERAGKPYYNLNGRSHESGRNLTTKETYACRCWSNTR